MANPLRTADNASRQAAQIRIRTGLYGRIGQPATICDDLTAGHPIDAPDRMPAGSMNCTEWVSYSGAPLVRQSEARRS